MSFIGGIIAGIVVLGVLIVVHEFGHFIFAKRLGVGVLKFSVGFGPKLIGRTFNETEYVLSAVPLGGYVKMIGEDPEPETGEVDPRVSFAHQSLWKRILIVAAGPVFNIFFAFLMLSVMFWAYGLQVPSEASRIGGVMADMPAARAGLQNGDLVTEIDGQPISTWEEMSEAVRASEGREITVGLERGADRLEVALRPVEREEKDIFGEVQGTAFYIGIGRSIERAHVGLLTSIARGGEHTLNLMEIIVTSVIRLFQGRVAREDIGGPIRIVQLAGEQAREGLERLLHFTAVISITLGILNLLPIPILDGGHLLFCFIEALMRRPVKVRHREIAQQVGLVILVGVMLFAFYNDITHVLRGSG